MVNRKNLSKKYVLVSVYNKNKLKYLCENLYSYNYRFISTNSTYKKIVELGYKCINVSKITNFKEILDGRVKTLHPKIYASLLYKRDDKNHEKEFKKLRIPKIDMVVINLYPFEKFMNIDENRSIDMIDIGGVSLLRASSKNFKSITTISEIKDYYKLIENIKKNNGESDIFFRRKMASKSFSLTAQYDNLISSWILNDETRNKIVLKYGENPNQEAHLIEGKSQSIFKKQLNGKKISFNNILDVDRGIKCLKEFVEPTSIILKHNNPCGVASANNINLAFEKSLNADKKSSFGGIILLNRKVNSYLAKKIIKDFYEIVVAPKFDKASINILKTKSKLILLEIDKYNINNLEFKSTIFGNIYQKISSSKINKAFLSLASSKKSSKNNLDDMIFALKVVKHLNSNAIVLSKSKQTIGLGLGQTNRIDALKQAIIKMKKNGKYKNFVCASDGFFPFTDGVKQLIKNNCSALVQPSGSIKDKEIVQFANKHNFPIYYSKNRLFKH